MSSNKKDIRNILLLICILIIIILILTRFKFIYGSTMDFVTQHWTFPEYFRNLFYSTKDILPDFAFNIGAGQNIYNLSYYGFLNPIILLSYLFPFIKMINYMVLIDIIGIIASIILFYKWLRNNNFSSNLTFLISFIFMCSSPLIFHSHRHIMFVNYIPFLILGLISIDSYFKIGKKWALSLSTFLLIMTSYYYSIPSLFVFLIYGIYSYLKKEKKITLSKFIKDGFEFLIPIFTGILMAGILLIPTLGVILTGRGESNSIISLKKLLIPNINLNYLLYSSYSIGLTAIAFLSLIHTFITRKKENTFISIIISIICIFPIFNYILNGMLYINAKVLIPFIPLVCLLIGYFIKDIFDNKINYKLLIIVSIIISIIVFFTLNWKNLNFFYIDLIITLLFIGLYLWKNKKFFIIITTIIIVLTNCIIVNLNDNLVDNKTFDYTFNNNQIELFNKVLQSENNIYRSSNLNNQLYNTNRVYNERYYSTSVYSSTYSSEYRNFYNLIFNNPIPYRNNIILSQSNNILWNTFMGIKYILTDQNEPIGYKKMNTNGTISVFKNDNVLPIGYASNKLMSESEFDKLNHPYQLEAILNNIIVDKHVESTQNYSINKIDLNYNNIKYENLKIRKQDEHYIIEANNNAKMVISLNSKINNELLIIRFNMNLEQSCKDGDTLITINGIDNTLTCKSWKYKNKNSTFDYVISSNNNIDSIILEFNKGKYDINNIETYLYNYDNVIKSVNIVDKFIFDKDKTKGDIIEGNIEVKNNGYFNISIPYDKGFKIYVDGKNQKYEKTNKTFIGFPIKKGNHNIKIVYEAPLKNIGMIISVIGIIGFSFITFKDIRIKKRGLNSEKG